MTLDRARTVADAVLYEGYLLYPYRASSRKNQVRWQFGVLGPPGAVQAGLGEESDMASQCLLRDGVDASVTVYVRFLQLQVRAVERATDDGFVAVAELRCGGATWLSWDEAVAQELSLGPFALSELQNAQTLPLDVPGGEESEPLVEADGSLVGRVVRRREALAGTLRLSAVPDGELVRLEAAVENTAERVGDKDEAIRRSFIGAHLLLAADGAEFVSVIDPPDDARDAVGRCAQRRCWPVLAGAAGETDVVLASPIILYDHPEVAEQSAGALFDSTEIDEILTLRVMTLTEDEKAQARATDPHAAAIIDRCEQMSPQDLQRLHGILRDPHAGTSMPTGDDWWAAEAAADVTPEADSVLVGGVPVAKGSLVRLRPSRRADAQDLFFTGQTARVNAVHVDLDGETHVAVVMLDDPAAEFHDWYGRYLYFAPDELEPLPDAEGSDQREESSS